MHLFLMKYLAMLSIILLIFPSVFACKDIIVMNSATEGEYNILMKVRDPSRPGLQVLFMVEKGYRYSYHHPWLGYEIPYEIKHKLLGVATLGDTPPNIIKAGMLLSDACIAYGDADCPTYYINPSRYAWDDFDWLRYAAQNASNEDEAVDLLEEVVRMHAPGIGENLFVVGKEKAYVIEADAFHFVKEEVNDFAVMSNYPKKLWQGRLFKKLIASDFDTQYEKVVRKWHTVRLGGIFGIRVLKIGNDWIVVKQIPSGEKVKIEEGKGAKVGYFYVKLLDIQGKKARIRICYEYYEWERKILDILKRGKVSIIDLINISRLHSEDLEGLRGMCEGESKATMIFKIPINNNLCMGWFAPDQCASIFVPVHLCDKDIYEPYKNGKAAEIALNLLRKFGKINFSNVEKVLVRENEKMENIAIKNIDKASSILTIIDMEMQKQAFLFQKLWLNSNEGERSILSKIWNNSYYDTICNIEKNLKRFDSYGKEILAEIALSIGKARTEIENIVNGSDLFNSYRKAEDLIQIGDYIGGVRIIKNILKETDKNLFGIEYEKEEKIGGGTIITISFLILVTIVIILKRKRG